MSQQLKGHIIDPYKEFQIERTSLAALKEIITELRREKHEAAGTIAEFLADPLQLEAFIETIFRYARDGYVQFRMFNDGEEKRTWGWPWQAEQVSDRCGLLAKAIALASNAALSADRVNFCPPAATFIGPKKATKDDLCEGLTIISECDHRPDAARETLGALLGAPTLIVKSGGTWIDPETELSQDRCHVYWRLATPAVTKADHLRLERANDIVTRIVASDPTAVPSCHPLRWPGSWHKKATPRLVRIAHINPEREVVLDDVLPMLEDAARDLGIALKNDRPPAPPAPRMVNPDAIWNVERDAAHIVSEYLGRSSGRHHKLYGCAVKIAMSALNAGYDIAEGELHDILRQLQGQNPSGSLYCEPELARLAKEGLANAAIHVGNDPAYKKKAERAAYWDSEIEWVRRDMEEGDDCEEPGDDDYEDLGDDDDYPVNEPAEPTEPAVTHHTQHAVAASPRPSSEPANHAEPLDIFASLSPRPVLTRDMLPPVVANFAFDEAERMGVEPACIAVPCLIVCAAAIHDAIKIQPKTKDTRWTESARLWAALVGEPGVGKSPALGKAVEPCRDIEAEWRIEDARKFAEYERQMEDYKHLKSALDTARRKGEDCEEPEEPEEPHERRLLVNEMSMEGLAERILAHNERGVLVVCQELMGLIGGFDAYKNNGVKKDRTAALELFDGGPRNRDLVRDTVWVPNWSACIAGTIQTDKLAKVAPTLVDDGLLQRFMMTEVRSTGMGEDRKPDMDAVGAYDRLVRSLTRLKPQYFGDPIVLSPEAQVFREEVQSIAYALKEETTMPAAFRGHANKLHGIYARLLLTLHMIETPHHRTDLLATVADETAKHARDLMIKFFIPQALHLYGMFFGEGASDARWIAGHILAHKCQTIKARDLKRSNKSAFQDNAGRLYGAMDTLVEYQWVKPIRKATGEKPVEWEVSPLVHTRYAELAEQERDTRKAAGAKAMQRKKVIDEAFA
jgi:Protein of unknown function (DUF3987)